MGEKPSEMEECLKLCNLLQSKPEAEAFLSPVDWKALNLPDYPQIIKQPMDLGTIEKNLKQNVYKDSHEFSKDMRLIWKNAKTYNQEGSGIYVVAHQLEGLFEKRFANIHKSATKKRESTQKEREIFTTLVKQLTAEQLGLVVEMIELKCPQALSEGGQDDLEIEVYDIDGESMEKLNDLVKKCVEENAQTVKE
ncbi:hypothetical protein MHBO_002612 [Bonamia ostreae]|uniref:Bromodomain containing protein n=1 Tax=Bonamia ostreae TaxID=126728 RepID=A0ABV2ANV3_9EUKA